MNCNWPRRSAKRCGYLYAVFALIAAAVWAKHDYSVPATTLSVRIGKTYGDQRLDANRGQSSAGSTN